MKMFSRIICWIGHKMKQSCKTSMKFQTEINIWMNVLLKREAQLRSKHIIEAITNPLLVTNPIPYYEVITFVPETTGVKIVGNILIRSSANIFLIFMLFPVEYSLV